MTFLTTLILISAVLLILGVMTIARPSAKKKEPKSAGQANVRIRYAGNSLSVEKEHDNAPVIETGIEDLMLDSLEDDPLERLSDKSISDKERNRILSEMKSNGYSLRKKLAQPKKVVQPQVEEKVFIELDDQPCDELLEAPLEPYQDADYQ